MDRYKSLYKENLSVLSPRESKRMNREILNANRAKQRMNMFSNGRKISLSPTPIQIKQTISATSTPCVEKLTYSKCDKENLLATFTFDSNNESKVVDKTVLASSRIARVACEKDPKKLSHQQKFLMKYIEWKENKKANESMKKIIHKIPPFISSGSKPKQIKKIDGPSFAPNNYKFIAPNGLINPAKDDLMALKDRSSQRKSLYSFVPTPTKKSKEEPNKLKKKIAISQTSSNRSAITQVPKQPVISSGNKPQCKLKTTAEQLATKPEPSNLGPNIKSSNLIANKIPRSASVVSTVVRTKHVMAPPLPPFKVGSKPSALNSIKADLGSLKKNSKKDSVSGIINKVHTMQNKCNVQRTKKEIKLSVSMKAKKPEGKPSRSFNRNLIINSINHCREVETPCEHNSFAPLVTSTNQKSSPHVKDHHSEKISSMKSGTQIKGVKNIISAKRAILQSENSNMNTVVDQNEVKNKFNFRLYSEMDTDDEKTIIDFPKCEENDTTSVVSTVEKSKTVVPPHLPPIKVASELRVLNSNKEGMGPLEKKSESDSVSGIIKKLHGIQNKSNVQTKKKEIKLSVSMKAKKPEGKSSLSLQSAAVKSVSRNLIINSINHCREVETPCERISVAPFVTSMNQNSAKISSMKSGTQNKGVKNKISATRAILQSENPNMNTVVDQNEVKNKFNFRRDSEVDTDDEKTIIDFPKCEENDTFIKDIVKEDVNAIQATNVDNEDKMLHCTPKREGSERPLNYVSPFVSVSRGKVNAITEKNKRNSTYLQCDTPQNLNETDKNISETQIENRRTLETVRYFRKQLAHQIERLHGLCDGWEVYKSENLKNLMETGGEDMINVTIGQTKLLTSKKFMQFKGLIDRCEARATGQAPEEDGSENTKLITGKDLEGFWTMLGLQVDNVDKRFETLEKWKANNWSDPDAVKLKETKKKLTKNIKRVPPIKRGKASSGVQELIRKMQTEMRKQKTDRCAHMDKKDIILTPLRNKSDEKRSGTPTSLSNKRRSILVRDRKSFSAARTVLSVSSPRLSNTVEEFNKKINKLQNDYESNNLLRTALHSAELKKGRLSSVKVSSPVVSIAPLTPTSMKSRKSILKTPGTAKGKSKNVIFENRVQQFKFLVVESSDSEDEENVHKTSEDSMKQFNADSKSFEDESGTPRVYSLRTRKIALRPSCEIIIPT